MFSNVLKSLVTFTFFAAIVCVAIGAPTAAYAVVLPPTPGSTLLHHWDAFDPAGTGVQPPDGPITSLVDTVGGNHANLSGGNPIYFGADPGAIGGQPTIRFTAPDGLRSIGPISDQTVTMFSVSKLNGGLNRRLITGTPNNYLLGYHGGVEETGFNGNWFGGMTGVITNPHMYIHVAANDTTDTLWDGSNIIANSRGPGAGTAISNLGFGGINWSGGETSNGDISEIIIFDSDMNPGDFANVGLYLAQKYGFQAFGHDGSVLGGGEPAGSAVPEPSAFLLGLFGLVGFGLMFRRRRGLTTAAVILLCLMMLPAVAVEAATVQNLGTVTGFGGADLGEGLDLQGNIVYAVAVGNNQNQTLPTVNNGGPLTFVGDNGAVIPGYSHNYDQIIAGVPGGWSTKPNYPGSTPDDDRLEDVMHPIRWSNKARSSFFLDVTPGEQYRLQTLISPSQPENRGWDIAIDNGGEALAIDNIFSAGVDAGGGGGPFTPGSGTDRGVVWSYDFTANVPTVAVHFDEAHPGGTASGAGDNNAILSGITLEQLAPEGPAVPEPSALMLALLSLAGLCGLSWRRRRIR